MSILDNFVDEDDEEKTVTGNVKKPLHDLAKSRYLNYAMSVITSRALPDVRDGLKPVHRRILYAMYADLRLTEDKKHRKSAAVVGEVMGKYHPHGDQAIYDSMVRMAQDFSMRMPLVDGHGNFGNIDGDNAAAMRYTEARLKGVTGDLLSEIKKDTVTFRPNYDNTNQEPVVLPATLPLLLINGSTGIAVGMATNIPPHNPDEVIDAAVDLLRNPTRRVSTLVRNHILGPDFPTGGDIVEGEDDIVKMYEEGTGSVTIRSKWHTEKKGRRQQLIVTEIPYGVTKQSLVEKIAKHILDDELPQIEDIRDESTRDIRIVLELKYGADVNAAMAYLLKYTPLESKFHTNLTCLIPDPKDPERVVPERLDLKEMLQAFLDFRMEVIQRRLEYDLKGLESRIHILEGFVKVLDSVDKAIEIVMGAKSKDDARDGIMSHYSIDHEQADHVLNTKIYRLANYETQSIRDELKEKTASASEIRDMLADEDARKELLISELKSLKRKYGSDRLTTIEADLKSFEYDESLYIEELDVFCVVSRAGWVRRQKSYTDLSTLRVRDGDELGWVLPGNTRDVIQFYTNVGKVYTSRINELPDTTGFGEPIQSMFSFDDGEKVIAAFTEHENDIDGTEQMVAVAAGGNAVRFDASKYMEPSTAAGRSYMRLDDGDGVVNVEAVQNDDDHMVLVTRDGRCLSFPPEEINHVKGVAKGVKTMTLNSKDEVLAFSFTSGTRGGSLCVETNRGAEHDVRHTTYGVGKRGQLGSIGIKRGSYVKWLRETREVEE